jgi:glycosyltransferase involved in cell wall biosynthesis
MKSSIKKLNATKVSIGLPVYNGEKYIRDALDSLINQTFTDFELIISDNASIDNTEKICREYMSIDSRISFFRQDKNIGAIANFSFVLAQAKSACFMWAAYDDVWDKEYLNKALCLLEKKDIDFVFPTFMLKSIGLGFYKVTNRQIFDFIDSADRRLRVLKFLALHHDSHKCNIVYSLFNTEFLREALKKQDIGNDGTLGTVITSMGRGALLDDALFQKRYPYLWPGLLSPIFRILGRQSGEFKVAKDNALNNLKRLFPEYATDIEVIFNDYKPYTYNEGYLISNVENLIDFEGSVKG